ncbi:O-acetylhomoserine sulfhydrylase [Streptococcus infantarius subsp. infantarius]|nr:O-acetylhomoserine sulfhydrylase [Streptococcus infantarius subsp. infantarius]MCO4637327.1 O-acetylhomoserine sulfhydrylase [Streptococcus infantarius subsp. infantarius]MCO4642456.1 O-acetylhomoserine sulfhydrylase [Streptococcus infantarius subsp. infantarius]MCO4643290.1 O-acetylhomoserine sulfhydrylase [Streptococcus infantarius subsp. infantarius]MCO4651186.1 O-acetylhomoserine sulfhydrylase [Streptococcus infantarius subsp. infantarius]
MKKPGNIYSRIGNPTVEVFENRIAALENGVGAVATSSGMAAITYAVLGLAHAGDHVVAATTLYGGTFNLLKETLPRYGVTTTFVDVANLEEVEAAIKDNTKLVLIETLGNPVINIPDIEKIADIAHAHKIPLVTDNTFGTPYLINVFSHGVDIAVHSATKFIGGHGTTIAGVVVDSGNFDWEASGKFLQFVDEDPSYHNISYTRDIGAAAFITALRVQLLRDTGAALSPFSAFLLLQGLETLSLRIDRHIENTKKIVDFLSNHPKVEKVNYPSLLSSPYYDLAQKYFPKGAGSIFTFHIKGGQEEAHKFIDNLEIFSDLANVADAKSLVVHPATTTHQQLSEEDLKACGVTRNQIRVSVGLENADDLIEDLRLAFEKI